MKHDLLARIAQICVGGLVCLVISTPAIAENQPSAAVSRSQGDAISILDAKAQIVNAALNDMRASLKAAADMQATMDKEFARKGQAEANVKASQEARKAAERNLDALKSRLAAAEKELTVLEKQKESVAKLQQTLAQLSQRRAEAEAEAQHAQAARAEVEQAVAELKSKVVEAEKKSAGIQVQAGEIKQLRSALDHEKQLRDEGLKRVEQASAAAIELEKEKNTWQARLAAQDQRLADAAKQKELVGQLQAELTTIRQAQLKSQAKADEMAKVQAAVAQTISELKNKLAMSEKNAATLEKEGKVSAQLQGDLIKARKLGAEAEAAIQQAAVVKTAAEQEVASLQARLGEISKKVAAQDQTKQLQALRDEIDKEKQRQESLREDETQARKAIQEAEKEKGKLQAQLEAQAKRLAEGLSQQKALDQMQTELAKEKQVCRESKAKIAEANQAHEAAAQAMAALKQKLVAGEEQVRSLQKQAQVQDQLREKLTDIRKTNSEWDREVRRVMVSRAEIEQALTVFKAKHATTQTNINALAEQAVVIRQMQADLEKENQIRAAAVAQLEKDKAALEAAENEKATLQASINKLEKQAAEGAGQQKTLERLRDNLAQEKQARAKAEAQLTGAIESQKTVKKETADLRRKIETVEDQLNEQSEQAKALNNIQAELSKEQKARKESTVEAAKKAEALAAAEKEQNALKRQLVDLELQYSAKLEQVKAVAQARADLEKERKLRAQADQRMAEIAASDKALVKQNRDLKAQVQAAANKNTALAKDLDHQSQQAAAERSVAVANTSGRGEPESISATEKKILAQAKGEAPSGAIESGQDVDTAKSAEASSALRSFGSEANRHYQAGIQKWDAGDIDGAITEFKKTVSLDSSLAGAYYNIALGYGKKGNQDEACDYAYQAGMIYLKNKNNKQAIRMVVFIKNIDPSSSLLEKLRKEIAEAKP